MAKHTLGLPPAESCKVSGTILGCQYQAEKGKKGGGLGEDVQMRKGITYPNLNYIRPSAPVQVHDSPHLHPRQML
jgi:hypothetical protein